MGTPLGGPAARRRLASESGTFFGHLGCDDLRSMVALVVEALVPGREYRCSPAVHPYTRDGLEVEVRAEGRWVELLECGLAAPEVLNLASLPPE